MAQIDAAHLRIRLGHHAQQADDNDPDAGTDGDGDKVQRGDGDTTADDGGHQNQLALAAEEQIGAVQSAMQRAVSKSAHWMIAPALNSVDKMLVEKMISEITSTSMMIRRTKSLISPPNTSVAP